MDWRQQQQLERARQREERRTAKEFTDRSARQKQFVQQMGATPDPDPIHACPSHCHRCPDIGGEILPFCTAMVMAMDWEDMSVCTCHAGSCTCGMRSQNEVCQCAHIPLVIRQMGIVAYADREHERARRAEYERTLLANHNRHAQRLIRASMALVQVPSIRARLQEALDYLLTAPLPPEDPEPDRKVRRPWAPKGKLMELVPKPEEK